jgi:uncharacterized repeat protein (TIGR03837 family)
LNARATWDIFCRVVDNYGDIGIAWRLARQLTAASCEVRLFVDDLTAFARIEPALDAQRASQTIANVDIRRWPDQHEDIELATVVVELLGCGLPPRYLAAMSTQRDSLWIDFEHLSAESWVDGFHGLPSPHPTLPLTKHFFYPGFNDRTGGLLMEPDIERRRAAFIEDASALDAFCTHLGIPRNEGFKRVSLFAYPDAPVAGLLDAFAADSVRRWSVLVPDGVLTAAITRWFGGDVGTTRTRGSLSVTTIPFVDQDDYDRLLWLCDVNFVRGEDSFVRAQIAGRPLVWHIYPQVDAAHLAKLAAFETIHDADLLPEVRAAQRGLWQAWNDPLVQLTPAMLGWLAVLPELETAAAAWRVKLLARPPLVENLIAFAATRRPSP